MSETFTVEVYANGAVLVEDHSDPNNSVLLSASSKRAAKIRQALGIDK